MLHGLLLASFALNFVTVSAQKPTFYRADLPPTTETGQTGTNQCNDTTNASMCQNLVVNSIEDFCLWGAPIGPAAVGASEEIMIAFCTTADHGARVMPPGTITGAHFIE